MGLAAGTRLGPYEIVAPVGAGGMGEVYRARDTRLEREVALKILPEHLAESPERRARFEREAKAISQLNHPQICTLHDVGNESGVDFLVMELVEGETLAQRIARGPMKVEEAILLFVQIARGLEAAHEKGVLHRDLKPDNVQITPEGTAKILDFGLARAVSTEVDTSDVSAETSQSPTLTKGTASGVVLGTTSYMSPEQARGKPVDKRTDIWAFGCCLYEALTGRKAFGGETTTDVLAAVVSSSPDWSRLPRQTHPAILRVLSRALVKDPRHRTRDVGDLRLDLEEVLVDPSPELRASRTSSGSRSSIAAFLAGVIAAGVGLAIWLGGGSYEARERRDDAPTRFSLTLDDVDGLNIASAPALAVSPDGSKLVYAASKDGRVRLFLRSMDRLETAPLRGTEGAVGPFFSPDGGSIGFFANGKLKRVPASGGRVDILCDAQVPSGGVWGSDGFVYYGLQVGAGIFRVPEAGGRPEVVTRLDESRAEISHRFPELLDEANALVFTVGSGRRYDDADVDLLDLGTGERRTLIEGGTSARLARSGHLLFARNNQLFAAAFDPSTGRVVGPPAPVIEELGVNPRGAAHYSVSDDGSLAYLSGNPPYETALVWVDRDGSPETILQREGLFLQPRLSPSGGRIAASIHGANVDVWVYDLTRKTFTRATTADSIETRAVWTPDGKELTYLSDRTGEVELFNAPVEGRGGARSLDVGSGVLTIPGSWSPDGAALAYAKLDPTTGWDVWLLHEEDGPLPFLRGDFDERHPMFSPDGRWLAYTSNESGRDEIYATAIPGGETRVPISSSGGTQPLWSRDGTELFYRNGNQLVSVPVASREVLDAGEARVLFEKPFDQGRTEIDYTTNYDVSQDGSRFLMVQRASHESVYVVLGWFEELGRASP